VSPLRVALTGGIATAKTHCLARFAALGAPVIDGDAVARKVVEPGSPALQSIVERFGEAVLQPNGRLDRAALGRIVFADSEARHDLEAIVHPAVYTRIFEWYESLRGDEIRAAIAEIPLLYETRHEADFDRIIVAACPPSQQLERLIARDGLSIEQAQQRIAAQMPIDEKRRWADDVIDTSVTIEAIDLQIVELWGRLRSSSGR
jgi:dephospho-CoA kinase